MNYSDPPIASVTSTSLNLSTHSNRSNSTITDLSVQAIPEKYSEPSTSNIFHQEISLTADEESLGSPFKRALFWPENKPDSKRKKKSFKKIPSVATSNEWKKYYKKKTR